MTSGKDATTRFTSSPGTETRGVRVADTLFPVLISSTLCTTGIPDNFDSNSVSSSVPAPSACKVIIELLLLTGSTLWDFTRIPAACNVLTTAASTPEPLLTNSLIVAVIFNTPVFLIDHYSVSSLAPIPPIASVLIE
ncbi:MAG: hypothetical protein U5R46_20195 [Gammaproteobacteria bacterium]|nr:hypothetical protein [Gammaproteobacteria bacterium]